MPSPVWLSHSVAFIIQPVVVRRKAFIVYHPVTGIRQCHCPLSYAPPHQLRASLCFMESVRLDHLAAMLHAKEMRPSVLIAAFRI
jgi:hypothetical protein